MPYRSPFKPVAQTQDLSQSPPVKVYKHVDRDAYERAQKQYVVDSHAAHGKSEFYTEVRRAAIIGLCFFGGAAFSMTPLGLGLAAVSALSVLTLALAAEKIDNAPIRAFEQKQKNMKIDNDDKWIQRSASETNRHRGENYRTSGKKLIAMHHPLLQKKRGLA